MKPLLLFVSICFIAGQFCFSKEYHHAILKTSSNVYIWDETTDDLFDGMLLSWNGHRPVQGAYSLYVRVCADTWSPWLFVASWGPKSQHGNRERADFLSIDQDSIRLMNGKKGGRFQVRVQASEGTLDTLFFLHMCAVDMSTVGKKKTLHTPKTIFLPVVGISQYAINFIGNHRICSPVSTTAVIRYLTNSTSLDPIVFAHRVFDTRFNIFGNWSLNCAEASSELGNDWNIWVEYLTGFQAIYDSLYDNIPVIISVRGPLKGSASSYTNGHLIAIIGFDTQTQEVLCMDPAWMGRENSCTRYQLQDLLQAWQRRDCVAYRFKKNPL